MGSADEQGAWDVSGEGAAEGAVEGCGGGGTGLQLHPGSTVGPFGGSGTEEGGTARNQRQQGHDCVTLTVCTKGLTWEAGKQSQYS